MSAANEKNEAPVEADVKAKAAKTSEEPKARTGGQQGGPRKNVDATTEWEAALGKSDRVCCVTERVFAEGDDYVSTLEAGEEGLVRRDYDPEHFDETREDVFAFWRYRVQADEDANKPRPLDVNFLADFFRRLQTNPTAGPREVAYIVALLLVRKKVLLLEGSEPIAPAPVEEGAEPDPLAPKENLLVRFAKEEDATTLKVAVPELSEDKMEAIRDDLGRIFNLGDAPQKKGAKSEPVVVAETGILPGIEAEADAPSPEGSAADSQTDTASE